MINQALLKQRQLNQVSRVIDILSTVSCKYNVCYKQHILALKITRDLIEADTFVLE